MIGLKGNIPLQVVRLGLRCNEKCLFCNVLPDSGEAAGFELALRAVSRAAAAGGGARISISGGEPTLYPELAKLITYAGQKGVEVELQTNGIRLAAALKAVEELVRAGLARAFVSLHSHIPRIHDFLTGVPGSHAACVKAIRHFISCGVQVALNPVLTTANFKGIPDYVRFVGRELGVRPVSLSVVQPRGRVLKNRALLPDYRILDRPVAAALKIAGREGVSIINPVCGLPLCIGDWYKYPEQNVEYSLGKLGLPFTAAKEKAPVCGKCALAAYCAGVWPEYAVIRGFGALRAVKKEG